MISALDWYEVLKVYKQRSNSNTRQIMDICPSISDARVREQTRREMLRLMKLLSAKTGGKSYIRLPNECKAERFDEQQRIHFHAAMRLGVLKQLMEDAQ